MLLVFRTLRRFLELSSIADTSANKPCPKKRERKERETNETTKASGSDNLPSQWNIAGQSEAALSERPVLAVVSIGQCNTWPA